MSDIEITVNGEARSAPEKASVADVLSLIDVDPSATGIAVAVNDRVVRRDDWATHVVGRDDRIEVIQATQGG